MKMKRLSIILIATLVFILPLSPVFSEENIQNEILDFNSQDIKPVPVVNDFLQRIQKYTGFNFLTDFVAETVVKSIVKAKTKAEIIKVNLQIYSGIDLLMKKAKFLSVDAEDLLVSNIPIEKFTLETKNPIYFKKNKKKKYQVGEILNVFIKIQFDASDISKILNSLPKWQKVLGELELPVPPFGLTRVTIRDLNINIDENGFVVVSGIVKSLENPEAEPIKMLFSGNLVIREKKLVIDGLSCEMEDIFTKDSDMGKSFSGFLEDLVNPVFDFHKYEKRGLTIDFVNLTHQSDKLLFDLGIKLLPEEINENIK